MTHDASCRSLYQRENCLMNGNIVQIMFAISSLLAITLKLKHQPNLCNVYSSSWEDLLLINLLFCAPFDKKQGDKSDRWLDKKLVVQNSWRRILKNGISKAHKGLSVPQVIYEINLSYYQLKECEWQIRSFPFELAGCVWVLCTAHLRGCLPLFFLQHIQVSDVVVPIDYD